MKKISIISIVLLIPCYIVSAPHKAVVIAPVADLVGSPIQKLIPDMPPTQAYASIPLCGGNTNKYLACPRIHQLLFNEIITIVETKKDQALVHIPNFFYTVDGKLTPQHAYWTPTKNLMPLKKLAKNGIDLKKIPHAISFHKKKIDQDTNTVTLALPFYDSVTQQTFSAGTRFIQKRTDNSNKNVTTVFILDKKGTTFHEQEIPQSLLISHNQKKLEEKVNLFVKLVKQWAHQSDGFIPYVWGGCSFISTYQGSYSEVEQLTKRGKTSFFTLSDDTQSPKVGLDCSGLIGRAAQICGIPYFFKNTRTIAQNLTVLKKNDEVRNGDIIWIPGHVMVVSDAKNNMMVEARARLNNSHGKIHEIALKDVFKDVTTYHDLMHAFHTKKALNRLDMDGKVFEVVKNGKILSLASVWH